MYGLEFCVGRASERSAFNILTFLHSNYLKSVQRTLVTVASKFSKILNVSTLEIVCVQNRDNFFQVSSPSPSYLYIIMLSNS